MVTTAPIDHVRDPAGAFRGPLSARSASPLSASGPIVTLPVGSKNASKMHGRESCDAKLTLRRAHAAEAADADADASPAVHSQDTPCLVVDLRKFGVFITILHAKIVTFWLPFALLGHFLANVMSSHDICL